MNTIISKLVFWGLLCNSKYQDVLGSRLLPRRAGREGETHISGDSMIRQNETTVPKHLFHSAPAMHVPPQLGKTPEMKSIIFNCERSIERGGSSLQIIPKSGFIVGSFLSGA